VVDEQVCGVDALPRILTARFFCRPRGCLVRADWRAKHGASPVAFCESGGEEVDERVELGHHGLERYCA